MTGLWFLAAAALIVSAGDAASLAGQADGDAQAAVITRLLGSCVGDDRYDARHDLNRDGCINVLDLALHRSGRESPSINREARGTTSEAIVFSPAVDAVGPGDTTTVLLLIQSNTTPLLGYSLDIEIEPQAGTFGTLQADVESTNFYEPQNLIVAGGAFLDPLFSVILDAGDGGVFVNAITEDNSTVLATAGVNDVLAQVYLTASTNACGTFDIQLGPASVLSDGNAFAVPFMPQTAVIQVGDSVPGCVADLDCDGVVGASDLAAVLGSWGPCPNCPSDFDGDEQVTAADLATVLAAWGTCN